MSIVTGSAFFVLAISALVSGWLSDKWIVAGATPTRVRKTFTGAGLLIASSILLVGIVVNHHIAVAILILVCIGLCVGTSNLWSVTQTLPSPATSAKWARLQNFTGNLAGRIAAAPIRPIHQHP